MWQEACFTIGRTTRNLLRSRPLLWMNRTEIKPPKQTVIVDSRMQPQNARQAMRPSSALSADGPLNFYNAVAVAANQRKWVCGRGGNRSLLPNSGQRNQGIVTL